ncbi:hypothetical protein [Sandaracinus amylolyticus]|uniref:hypothetical protein n=1 Tax=Sandaracinus amylolyticus TaxID=927083 RepID=UPI001F427E58|nr:hypothetical protein [Sandaracinus amylolyticus]UJR80146.1 Putative integral membrane protein [Sandaracinus amylolyticus]
MSRRFSSSVLLLLALACDPAPSDPTDAGLDAPVAIDAGPRCTPATGLPDPLVCNGHAELCDRAYDAVAFPTTHNAMSSEEDGWIAPNQGRNLWHQLEDGVRAFMLDTHRPASATQVMLCHGGCGVLGMRPLIDAMIELRQFMDCHPGEVLSIIFEPHVDEAPFAAVIEEAGLLPYLHQQAEDAPWPTLREMITSGRRLVIFTETSNVTLPWHHHAYDYVWDNDYRAESAADFDCDVLRGSRDNAVFVLNHFVTNPLASREQSELVNFDVLRDHALRCRTETGDFPNLVTVDFYDASDLFEVVDELNGL